MTVPPTARHRLHHRGARRALRAAAAAGEEAAELARKLGQLQPSVAVFPQECMGQLASFGPILTALALQTSVR